MNCKRVRKVAALICLICLSGCASIVSGGPKTFPIMSQPDEASIEVIDVNNDNSTILKAKTPYTAMLERSSGYFQPAKYKIRIAKEGYLPYETQIDAGINAWYFGNAIFGSVVGVLIVDPATGAMWKIYQDNINVKLYPDTLEGKMSMATEKYNGQEAFKRGDFDQCIEETTMGIAIYPQFYQGYGERATCYRKKNETDKALADATKAIELKGDYPYPYWERAETYILMGENAKAMDDLDKAIAIKPDLARAYFTRGKLQYALKNVDAAKNDRQKAAALGNSNAKNFQF